MENSNAFTGDRLDAYKSVTYILSGSLLYLYNGLAGGWTSGLASMFGFYLFIKGLGMLKPSLDECRHAWATIDTDSSYHWAGRFVC